MPKILGRRVDKGAITNGLAKDAGGEPGRRDKEGRLVILCDLPLETDLNGQIDIFGEPFPDNDRLIDRIRSSFIVVAISRRLGRGLIL